MRRLDQWRAEVAAEETMLLVSEVVTNAVTHVHSEVTVTVTVQGPAVRVGVHDDSAVVPVVVAVDLYDEHGRGMFLVDTLAGRWGVDRGSGPGKTVWFEMPLVQRAVSSVAGQADLTPTWCAGYGNVGE